MKQIVIIDPRAAFLQDLNTRIMLEEYDFIADTAPALENAFSFIKNDGSTVAVVCDLALDETATTFKTRLPAGTQVYGYCTAAEGRFKFSELSIPCVGIINKSSALLGILEQDPPPVLENVTTPKKEVPQQPQSAPIQQRQEVHQVVPPPTPPPVPVQKTGAEKLTETATQRLNEQADRGIEQDVRDNILHHRMKTQRKTKVITVYAAKGGVGKTTIASNTAVCLALTNNGRSKFRVCIVDYNIDFGDVCTTLNLNPKGANMVYWARDIRERIAKGEAPEAVKYDKMDMERTWLQKMDSTGLYALIAPVVHEDSMDIGEEELTIMIRNIIENGDFDYVVCDTGNNTRDSSVIALEMAEKILLVATQDVTTANCNDAFINTMKKIGFDTEKIKLIINNIIPAQATGISVSDIEKSFDYDCIARIKRNDDIVKSNNFGTPIVFTPNHDFTKQVRAIVNYITKDVIEGAPEEPKKKSFSFFGNKKGR